ncbi:heme A synthase [Methylibium sp. Root1272]|uniref:COX15/CtaA family protein n=1 Tax=Methylibium sp. Root1272 TaxID=1736441 RepID=UPI0006FF8A75|nr:COX15/CtaA family protein [Methylibium sp. Root1272]KQW69664.1 cytochrome C oxidase subunit I [Methylibium sp. Root1272]
MDHGALVNLEPLARMALLGGLIALGPLAWVWARTRSGDGRNRLRALTLLTLFLTFDLVLFGAFTRLTDSGLGCPDWPGCYGSASPLGARDEIQAAQSALPTGPVTHGKAWVEMVHRYLATAVGVLITVMTLLSWQQWRRDTRDRAEPAARISPWWATATLLWVCVQGAFGAFTVTLKLYPAIVTAHLLGGLALLALLAAQAWRPSAERVVRVSAALRRGVFVVSLLAVLQIALGAWVSTNYAVLACSDFPTCQGHWWPTMDFEHGFSILRPLGVGKDSDWLPFAALTAIHMTHRLGALLLLTGLTWLVWRLAREPALRRFAAGLVGVAAWQVVTGVSNAVLDWPLLAAVAHTGGAAALVLLLTALVLRTASADGVASPSRAAAPLAAQRAS